MTSPNLVERRQNVLGPAYFHFYDTPLHLVKGQDVWLWDANGRKYLDCYNNVASVGHCHPTVVEALHRQASTLNTHTRYLHEGVVELGERLNATLPDEFGVTMLVCTGTEANDLAVQMARHVTGGQGIVVTEASYHGNSELVRILSTDSYPPEDRPEWLAVIEPPNLYRGPITREDPNAGAKYLALAVEELDRLEARGQKLGALIIDTSWDSNGPMMAPVDYVQGLCAEVKRRGGLIIADEVQAGYCRMGDHWWGFTHYDISPDIVTCGKPMGDGHPLAMMATSPELAADFAKKYSYFNTFGGNPVSSAVGNAVIDVIEDQGILHNATVSGAYLMERLQSIAHKHVAIGDIQGRGLFIGIDIVADPVSKVPASPKAIRRLGTLLAEEGVITGKSGRFGQILKLRPPLTFSPEHADLATEAIDQVLSRFDPSA